MNPLEIFIKPWQQASQEAYLIRKKVFIEEQGVPEAMELDEFDPTAQHALAYIDSECVGTARLVTLAENIGRIGRMAVLKEARGRGYGARLLQALIRCARERDHKEVRLSAQRTAQRFYAAHGFVEVGEPFDEVGIPHVEMRLVLV